MYMHVDSVYENIFVCHCLATKAFIVNSRLLEVCESLQGRLVVRVGLIAKLYCILYSWYFSQLYYIKFSLVCTQFIVNIEYFLIPFHVHTFTYSWVDYLRTRINLQ